MTTMLDQINTYRSVVGSDMGDPVPVQQLPTMMDDVVPPSMVVQFPGGFFRRPFPPKPLRIDRPVPKPLIKLKVQVSRSPSPATSSVQAGEGAAEIAHRLREESPSPDAEDQM